MATETATLDSTTPSGSAPPLPGGMEATEDAFALLLNPPSADNQKDEELDEENDDADDLEVEEDDDDVAEDESEGETEDEDADEDESEEEDGETEVYAVKVNGEEVEVPIDELISGYSRQQDYTKKTQELAELRKETEAAKSAAFAEREQYLEVVTQVRKTLEEGSLEAPDWDAMFAEDPNKYVREKDLWRDRQDKVKALKEEELAVTAKQQAERQVHFKAYLIEQRDLTLKAIPQWKDKKVLASEREEMQSFASDVLGYPDDAVSQISDHKTLVALRMATKYHLLTDKKRKATSKTGKPIGKKKVRRVLTPGGTRKRTTSTLAKAKRKLAKTHSLADATSAFEALLNSDKRGR